MLAIDRRIFDIPLEERLQSRTSDLVAWTKTMLPTIRLSISEAQNQLRTGHQDIRTYFSDTAAPERNMNETLATTTMTTTTATTITDRIGPRQTDFRQPPQQTRNQPATTSTNIRRPRYQDICNFLSGTTVAVITTHATQTATEQTIASTDNLLSRCRALRNRLQPPRSQVTQDTAEEPTTPMANTFQPPRPPQPIPAHTITGDASRHGRSDHFHSKYFL
jgi:hypothetical protein